MYRRNQQQDFLVGIVEGFYGRCWSDAQRLDMVEFLSAFGFNTYLYCPKADAALRKEWDQPWPVSSFQSLERLSRYCEDRSLLFGVGLSPFELYRDYSSESRQKLKFKIKEINKLNVKVLAILFDDMPGDMAALAHRQSDIVADVLSWTRAERVLICPTYYSFDPVLERYFGAMPEGYWEKLGQNLDPAVEVFWTGNKVCSAFISAADIDAICAALGRKVILWDNYPVNDGAERSRHLYCQPLSGRDRAITARLSGHLCNPMNQANLSKLALTGLADLYGHQPMPAGIEARASILYGAQLTELLMRDSALFEQQGLGGLSERERSDKARYYSEIDVPAAQEIASWLRGEYRFDPACLTD